MGLLILDVGTTSMRGIVYDLKGKKLAVCQVPTHPIFGKDGYVSENPADWRDNTLKIIRSVIEQAGSSAIEAVAITSARTSITPIDRDGKPLMETIMWQDTRNREICRELSCYNGKCFSETGARVNTVFSGSKMTWVRRECPELYPQVYKFLNIPEYIVYLMTGEFCSDYTYASRTGLLDLRRKVWDPEMLELYEVEENKLCRLIEPGQTAGKVDAQFAAASGLREGIPVLHAGGDQQCAAVGQNVVREGNVSLVLGTGGFLIAACDRVPDNLRDDVICNCSSIAGKYVIESNVLACSAAFDWFAAKLYGMEKETDQGVEKAIDYRVTEAELAGEKDVTSCLVLPYFEGRGTPDWNTSAKAAVLNVTLATRRSEMFKSMMESIFMELDNHLEVFRGYTKVENIMISGGLTASRTLNQLQADVYGQPVHLNAEKESTALGAYLVALTGLGYFSSVEEAGEKTGAFCSGDMYAPDPEKHSRYLEKQKEMNRVYQLLRS